MRLLAPALLVFVLGGCASVSPLPAQAASAPSVLQTHAEQTGWAEMTSYEEVVSFYRELAARSPDVRLREIGESREGRPLLLVTLARPAVAEPWQAQTSGKPIILIGAQVHGDEPAGKEGLMMFARDLALGPLSELLDEVIFVFVPQLNPDGAEAGEWGTRANPAGFNLNRDYLRLDNPETQTMVEHAIASWRPHVIVDAHELPGPPRIYDFYTLYPANVNGPRAPSRLAEERVVPAVIGALEDAGYTHFVYHRVPGNTVEDLAEGISSGSYGARALSSYGGAQGAVSILFESLRERDARIGLEDRARRHRVAMEALARYVAQNPAEVIGAVEEGRAEMRRLGMEWNPADSIIVRVREVPSGEVDYRMREMRRTEDGWQPTGDTLELRVPLLDSAVVTLARVRPVGYAIEPHRGDLADHLASHGLQVERLLAPAEVRVESFHVDSIALESDIYEGYVPQTVWTTTEEQSVTLPAGTYLVRAAQPTAAIAFHLLEPEDDNSYASVGRFAAEARRGRPLPVHRLMEIPNVPTTLLP